MVGMLKGKLFLVAKEENVIKASKPNESDSKWFRLTFSNQMKSFECTCGESWKVEVEPSKVVDFKAIDIPMMVELECTFDVERDSKGYTKIRLRTYKPVTTGKDRPFK